MTNDTYDINNNAIELLPIVGKIKISTEGETLDLQSLWEDAINSLSAQKEQEPWKKYNDILSWGYAMRQYVYSDCILFLGINPSLVTKEGNRIAEKKNPKNDIKATPLSCNHKYFKSIENLCNDLNRLRGDCNQLRHSHLDMFYLRCTTQSDVSEMLRCEKLKNFFVNQFKITKQVIFALNPIAIVVVNAFASNLLRPGIKIDMFGEKSKFPYNCKILSNALDGLEQIWDEKKGTYVIDDDSPLSGIPVFYSSMLSGQRALDVGSRQRLVWHINNVLKYK